MGLSFHAQLDELFFRFNIHFYIQSPQFNELRKYLVNRKGIKLIKPLFRGIRDGWVCVFGHNKSYILKHLKQYIITLLLNIICRRKQRKPIKVLTIALFSIHLYNVSPSFSFEMMEIFLL